MTYPNGTYTDGLSAPGTYNWTVAVPVNVVAGTYQLALLQGSADPVFSPAFNLVIPADEASSTTDAPTTSLAFPSTTGAGAATTTTVTAIYLPAPSNATYITYIYYEEMCGCHQTSSCPASAVPTSTSMTTATYLAAECGCTTTIEAPCAETVIPVATVASATNTPAAPSVAPQPPAGSGSPATTAATTGPVPAFTGAASKLAGSSFGLLAIVVALFMA